MEMYSNIRWSCKTGILRIWRDLRFTVTRFGPRLPVIYGTPVDFSTIINNFDYHFYYLTSPDFSSNDRLYKAEENARPLSQRYFNNVPELFLGLRNPNYARRLMYGIAYTCTKICMIPQLMRSLRAPAPTSERRPTMNHIFESFSWHQVTPLIQVYRYSQEFLYDLLFSIGLL
jgi:hypothetical protein